MIYKIENLSKSFHKQNHAANDHLSFTIEEGEIFSILGNNGAGKTTLIKQMLKMMVPSEGKILFAGKNIDEINNRYYYRQVNAVLEGNTNLYWYLTGYENFMYFGRLLGYRSGRLRERCHTLMTYFHLYEERNKKVGYYSRGMQQKMAIIIALINHPKVLFLDEPTLGLDIHAKRDVMKKIKGLAKHQHTTVILTSHQLDVIEELTDDVMILDKGRQMFLGPIGKLRAYYSRNRYHLVIKSVISETTVRNFFDHFQLKVIRADTELDVFVRDYEELRAFLTYLHEQHEQLEYMSKDSCSLEEIMMNFYGNFPESEGTITDK